MKPPRIPQVLVTLSPSGALQMELPGLNGSRRVVPLDGAAEPVADALSRVLHGQLQARYSVGEDGAPTEHQVQHWLDHADTFDITCPFCRAERPILVPKQPYHSRSRSIHLGDGSVTVRRLLPHAALGATKPPRQLIATSSPEELGL